MNWIVNCIVNWISSAFGPSFSALFSPFLNWIQLINVAGTAQHIFQGLGIYTRGCALLQPIFYSISPVIGNAFDLIVAIPILLALRYLQDLLRVKG